MASSHAKSRAVNCVPTKAAVLMLCLIPRLPSPYTLMVLLPQNLLIFQAVVAQPCVAVLFFSGS